MFKTLIKTDSIYKHGLGILSLVQAVLLVFVFLSPKIQNDVNVSDLLNILVTIIVGFSLAYYLPLLIKRKENRTNFLFKRVEQFISIFEKAKEVILTIDLTKKPNEITTQIVSNLKPARELFEDIAYTFKEFDTDNYQSQEEIIKNITKNLNLLSRQVTDDKFIMGNASKIANSNIIKTIKNIKLLTVQLMASL